VARLDGEVDLILLGIDREHDSAHRVALAESLEGEADVLLLVVRDLGAVAETRNVRALGAEEEAESLNALDGGSNLLALGKVRDGKLVAVLGALDGTLLGAEGHLDLAVLVGEDLARDKLVESKAGLPVLDKLVKEFLDHDTGDDLAAQRDEEAVGRDRLDETADLLTLLDLGSVVDLGVDDGGGRLLRVIGLHARRTRREVNVLAVNVDNVAESILVNGKVALTGGEAKVISHVGGVDTTAGLAAEANHSAGARA
jgi:hypothetical protein